MRDNGKSRRERLSAALPEAPPHSIGAEQSVLGSILLDNQAWDVVSDLLCDADFYVGEHGAIFRTIGSLLTTGQSADIVTVSDAAAQRGEKIDFAYLAEIANATPSAANVRFYAQAVREKSILRRTIVSCQETISAAYAPAGEAPCEILDRHQAALFAIADEGTRSRSGFRPMRDSLKELVTIVQAATGRPGGGLIGTPCGFDDVDAMLSGLRKQDMIVVAGRPSMGKTALALNMGTHVAIKEGRPVAIFSLEMSRVQLSLRMASSIARIDQNKLALGSMSDDEWARFTYATGQLSNAPIFIDDTPQLSNIELRSRARRLHREQGGLGLVVIDYLQLMKATQSRSENRVQEITEISQSVKALAKELDCPVVVLSQLNRGVEQRADKRPLMSDLRESGAIEQDADVIMFVYRDEYYNPDSQDKGTAEIIVGKHRNGPTGTVRLAFLGEYTSFANYSMATGY